MLLLSTSSLKWYWIHKIFSLAKKSWYVWLDLVVDRSNFDTLDENYLKSLIDEFLLPVLSITAPDKTMEKPKIDKIISIWEMLWCQIYNFTPPHITDKNIDFYISYLNKVKKDTKKTVSIQNIEQKYKLFVIPEYKNANLIDIKKITWDTTLSIDNIDNSSWIDLIKAHEILWNSIKNIFLSDKSWTKDWLLPWNAWWGVSFLPLESLMMKLKTLGYNWFFTLKVKSTELWAWNDNKVLQNLEQVKKYYEKHFVNYK